MMALKIPKYSPEFINAYIRFMTCKYIDEILKNSTPANYSNYNKDLKKFFGSDCNKLKKHLLIEHYFQDDYYGEINCCYNKKCDNILNFVDEKYGTTNKTLIQKINQGSFKDYKGEDWYRNLIGMLDIHIKNQSLKVKAIIENIKGTSILDFPNYFKELILLQPEEMKKLIQSGTQLADPEFEVIKKIYNLSQTIKIENLEKKINTYIIKNFMDSSIQGLLVCPYCNRNYINSRGTSLSAEIDHFYNKSNYPIFAVSLYNYIPCCAACNRLKKNKELKINPFLKGETDNFKFDFILNQDRYHIEIKHFINDSLNVLSPDLQNDLLSILQLDKAYEIHELEFKEMVAREQEYSQEYRDSLKNILSGTTEEINKKIDSLIYGDVIFAQDNELINKSLGKFRKDAYEKIQTWK